MHGLESIKKVGFLEWRDCWFCKVSMRKLFSLSSCLSLRYDSLQGTVSFKSAGL